MAQDPWEAAAAQYKTSQGQGNSTPAQASPNDAWKVWGATSQPEPSTADSLLGYGRWAANGLKNAGIGFAKEIPKQISAADDAMARIPHIGNWLTTPLTGGASSQQARDQMRAAGTANGNAQKIGQGIAQAGEFLIPGFGEEAAAGKVAEMAPRLAGVLKPAARIGYNALTSGAVNAAQGGGFSSGALIGAVGGTIGEGMRAIAPALAESAIGIRKADRAYGKTPGRMILDETKGLTPRAVANSAQGTLDQLNPQLNQAADRLSIRPRPQTRGLLQAPQRDIPLNNGVAQGSTEGRLFPSEYQMAPSGVNADVESPHYLSGSEHPEISGRFAPPSGVLRTREGMSAPVLDEFGRMTTPPRVTGDILTTEPNRIGSLGPARAIIGSSISRAAAQNAEKEAGQLQPMDRFLHTRFNTGEAIPENVTPRQLLDLRRGFGSEFVHNWNPEVSPGVTGTARRAYGALTDEFHNVAPGTADLDRRIGGLIPVAKRAESTDLNAPIAQRIAGRFKAHTGALTGAALGGVYGYNHDGGIPGAVKGATIGLVAPEVLGSPTVGMAMARTANAPRGLLRGLSGAALQVVDRDRDKLYSRRTGQQ
ncbi:hypothetical protein [Silvibacterium sp.]|uniref:hypothetical protein n=1 Tax=Silvibacterium sp. TaxID=1964179 RepID=UPI0039E22ECE